MLHHISLIFCRGIIGYVNVTSVFDEVCDVLEYFVCIMYMLHQLNIWSVIIVHVILHQFMMNLNILSVIILIMQFCYISLWNDDQLEYWDNCSCKCYISSIFWVWDNCSCKCYISEYIECGIIVYVNVTSVYEVWNCVWIFWVWDNCLCKCWHTSTSVYEVWSDELEYFAWDR
jgi:hypothetical protein